MSGRATEAEVEAAAVGWFRSLGYAAADGASLGPEGANPDRRSLGQVVLAGRLLAAVRRANPGLPEAAVEDAVRVVNRPPHPTLVENNRWLHGLLTDGVPVEYRDGRTGETRGARVRLVDFDRPGANDWLVVQQMIVTAGERSIRADLVVYLNGLPIAVVEFKNPGDAAADLWKAIDDLEYYRQVAPDLFTCNELLVASDGLLTRVGSITSGPRRFTPWRPADGGVPTLEALVRELFDPPHLLEYLRACVVFEEDERGNLAKKVAGWHQFRAVRAARAAVLAARRPDGDGRGGVVWHTQGSGKSLTMLMLGGELVRDASMANPTVVVVTDRNDLDDQLFDTFAAGRGLLRQDPVQADSREHLRRLLDRPAGGVIFTTIHKFADGTGLVSDRANVVVMADEAHRSQYGFREGGARWMRQALPNATFVGFTGTPIEAADKSTPGVFGTYADRYDLGQAVRDGATVPILFESRIVMLTVNEAGAKKAEADLAAAAARSAAGGDEDVAVSLEQLVGAQERVGRLAAFVVDHFERRREAIEGKGMVVAMSRDIAARLYAAIRKLRPAWHDRDEAKGFIKVVMTGSADEPAPLGEHYSTKDQRKRLARRFKDPGDDLRLVIVVDMWLTGFDCPPLHTIYLDKPLAGHNLMQTIARVNRVFGEKPGGVVVDCIGLVDQLADALAVYTGAGGNASDVKGIQDEAVPAMLSAFESLAGFFHGCDYAAALDADPGRVLRVYAAAADHVAAQDNGWPRFQRLTKKLAAAFALAVPRPEAEPVAPHLAFFQRLSVAYRKRLADDRDAPRGRSTDVDAAVRQVIGGAVAAGDVIDLFAAAGLPHARLDILSDEFLDRVSAIEQKNLALATLRKLLTDQIRTYERTNLVQSRRFREALEQAMVGYTNKAVSTAEVIHKLIELATLIRDARGRGDSMDLSDEEVAFYDALAENGSARAVMKSDALRLLARKLAEEIRQRRSLDWTRREAVKADLRRSVRRLLAKYGYPPDLSEGATQLVLKQAELTASAEPV